MDKRIPTTIQPLIENYVGALNAQFPTVVYGCYILGSTALGEFNEYFSDIDFVTVLRRMLNSEEIDRLRTIHHTLERQFPRWKMSGSYVQLGDLGKLDHNLEPHPHYHNGTLNPSVQNDINAITWWELKNRGIAVVGAEPQTLSFSVDWELLVKTMMENLNSYWASWAYKPVRFIMLYTDWGIQWAITGVLRQFYTCRENTITTKIKAAEYALGCLPPRWHPLIREAIDIRQRAKGSLYWFRIARAYEAVNFLRYIIQTCNAQYAQK
jgi:hypothetical protein